MIFWRTPLLNKSGEASLQNEYPPNVLVIAKRLLA